MEGQQNPRRNQVTFKSIFPWKWWSILTRNFSWERNRILAPAQWDVERGYPNITNCWWKNSYLDLGSIYINNIYIEVLVNALPSLSGRNLNHQPSTINRPEEMERPIPKSCTKKKLFDYNEVYRRGKKKQLVSLAASRILWSMEPCIYIGITRVLRWWLKLMRNFGWECQCFCGVSFLR